MKKILHLLTHRNLVNQSPLPLGWSGWVEGFCSYILGGRWKWPPKGSTKSVFLQNPPTSWTRTSLQNHSTQPHFFGALSPKSHSTKSQPLKTSISVIFSPLDFERVKKNKSDFVEKTIGNPTCDTHFLELISHHIPTYQKQPLSHLPSFSHFGPVWNIFLSALNHSWGACEGYWHYKMATLQFIETNTFTKWQPRAVFQLHTLQNHNNTNPTQKQRAPTQETESRSTVGTKWEKMCIMSPSLSSLKMFQATVSICIIFDQPFSILFIPFNFFKSKFSWCKQVGHWNSKMANRFFFKQTPLQNHRPGKGGAKNTSTKSQTPGVGAKNTSTKSQTWGGCKQPLLPHLHL